MYDRFRDVYKGFNIEIIQRMSSKLPKMMGKLVTKNWQMI